MRRSRKKKSADSITIYTINKYLGLLASLILVLIVLYNYSSLFRLETGESILRIFIYCIIVSCAVICAYWLVSERQDNKHSRTIVFCIFSSIAAYLLMSISNTWYFGGDAGHYLVLTKSLATFQGFQQINYIQNVNESLYGFTLPIILVPFYWLFGMNIGTMNFAISLTTIGFLITLYFLIKSELNKYLALLIVLALTVNYWIVWHSGVIMTEMPFFLFFCSTLILVRFYEHDEKYFSKFLVLLIFFTFLTYQVRVIGLALIPAISLQLIFHRQFKKAFIYSGLIIIILLVWNSSGESGSSSYFQFFKDAASLEEGESAYWYVGKGLFGNLVIKPFEAFIRGGLILIPMILSHSAPVTSTAIHFHLLYIIGLIGFGYHLREKKSALDFSIIFIFSGIAIYGGVHYPERWWMPLFPFLLYYLVWGFRLISEFIRRILPFPFHESSTKILNVSLLAIFLGVGLNNSDDIIRKIHPSRRYTEAGSAYVAAAEWIKENTQPDALIGSRLHYEFYLISERRGNNCRVWGYEPFDNSVESQQKVLTNIKNQLITHDYDYWILDNTRQDSKIVLSVLSQNPENLNEMFHLVYAAPQTQSGPLAYVLKVNKDWLGNERNKEILR